MKTEKFCLSVWTALFTLLLNKLFQKNLRTKQPVFLVVGHFPWSRKLFNLLQVFNLAVVSVVQFFQSKILLIRHFN